MGWWDLKFLLGSTTTTKKKVNLKNTKLCVSLTLNDCTCYFWALGATCRSTTTLLCVPSHFVSPHQQSRVWFLTNIQAVALSHWVSYAYSPSLFLTIWDINLVGLLLSLKKKKKGDFSGPVLWGRWTSPKSALSIKPA
jgi:hypothetical protein